MLFKKKCTVCGKEIIVNNPHYSLCSPECRRENTRRYHKNRRQKIRQDPVLLERHREEQRIQRRKNLKKVICPICQNNVPETMINNRVCRKRYHEECVVEEAKKCILSNGKTTDAPIARAIQRFGYTKAELIEELIEEGRYDGNLT